MNISKGDIGAFFGLMIDNLSNLVILAVSLTTIFGMPSDIVFYKMLPGSAVGVLVGDLLYTWMAERLAKKTMRNDVTAMPLGIDTPSTIGLIFGVYGPLYLSTKDPYLTWYTGMAVIVCMGVFKIVTSFMGDILRRTVPRPALLGSIAGIAILMIAFLPLEKTFSEPLSGFTALILVLFTLIAKSKLPGEFPGALSAVLIGGLVFYIVKFTGLYNLASPQAPSIFYITIPYPSFEFIKGLKLALNYLPIAIPFALATVIGGIDVTESAAVEGDEYRTRDILLVEGFATLIAGMCGGVIQSTPYIGHPAYKKMGGRSGYTFFTALFIGFGGIIGYLSFVVSIIPEGVIAPILIFIGLEILTQAFKANEPEYYPAVGIAFLPPLANLILIELTRFSGASGTPLEGVKGFEETLHFLRILGNNFILTSLIWSGYLSKLIEKKNIQAGIYTFVAGFLSLFGLIHSPLPDGKLFLPWQIEIKTPYILFSTYIWAGILTLILGKISQTR